MKYFVFPAAGVSYQMGIKIYFLYLKNTITNDKNVIVTNITFGVECDGIRGSCPLMCSPFSYYSYHSGEAGMERTKA